MTEVPVSKFYFHLLQERWRNSHFPKNIPTRISLGLHLQDRKQQLTSAGFLASSLCRELSGDLLGQAVAAMTGPSVRPSGVKRQATERALGDP